MFVSIVAVIVVRSSCGARVRARRGARFVDKAAGLDDELPERSGLTLHDRAPLQVGVGRVDEEERRAGIDHPVGHVRGDPGKEPADTVDGDDLEPERVRLRTVEQHAAHVTHEDATDSHGRAEEVAKCLGRPHLPPRACASSLFVIFERPRMFRAFASS